MKLVRIETDYQRSLANKIIVENHSYVPSINTVGRHVDYLIYDENKCAGMIGVGSATYPPCKDVLSYLGLNKSDYAAQFNTIANNWRFCISRSRRNLGTQVLKLLRSQIAKDWYIRYGDTLKYLVTFVGDGHAGTVYKADNWQFVGYTAGLPEHSSVSMKWMDSDVIKAKFVKPTGENRKLIFITDRITPFADSRIKEKSLFNLVR